MNKQIRLGEDPVYDAKLLGTPKMLLLGFQHLFAMFGATVLVPILVSGYGLPMSIQTTLLFAGLGTLVFHICSLMRVPAFLGSSFAFLGGFYMVAQLDTGKYATMSPDDKLAYALGGVVVAGIVHILAALLFKMAGPKRIMRFFPPIVVGPIIILIGLTLAPTAVSNASTNWPLALFSIVVIVAANIFGKGMIKIIPILLGVFIPFFFAILHAAFTGSLQAFFSSAAGASVVGLQPILFAKFDLTIILIMAPISIATMMEHIGDVSAISATCNRNYIASPGLHRTLLGDGLATSLSGMFGGPACTTYGENTGVLALSKVYDPRVVRLAAFFAIALSFSPLFEATIRSIPSAIIGGVSFILYGMISAVGLRSIVENHVDLTRSRNLIIAAVIFVCGLGFQNGLTFTVGGADITFTALAIAAIMGILTNAILPGNDYVFNDEDPEQNPAEPNLQL